MTQTILRTEFEGAYEVFNGTWGKYLQKCRDPEANATIEEDHLKHFELHSDIAKIPSEIWTPWVNLCFHFVGKVPSEMEVSIRLLRSETDITQYRAIVPRQSVSKSAVDADDFSDSCDLVTGEKLTEYPPVGWIPVGSSHSHNTMGAFFSGTDDSSQLKDPGIHFTVGSINTSDMTYKIASSVVAQGRRFKDLDFNDLINATANPDVTFHPNVLEYVDTEFKSPFPSFFNGTKFSKYLPPAKTTKVYDSIDEYFREKYGDDDEPYWYRGDSPASTYTYTDSQQVNPDQINDLINDFIAENVNDSKALEELKNRMQETIDTLDIVINS
jgi:hypothetical protein